MTPGAVRCVVSPSGDNATLFVACEDCWLFALHLRVDGSSSSSETKSSAGSPDPSSDPERVITLGILLRGFVGSTTSSFLQPCLAFGATCGGDESRSWKVLSADLFTPMCNVERRVIEVGNGDKLNTASSFPSLPIPLAAFPPPTCFLIRVMAVLGRQSGPL